MKRNRPRNWILLLLFALPVLSCGGGESDASDGLEPFEDSDGGSSTDSTDTGEASETDADGSPEGTEESKEGMKAEPTGEPSRINALRELAEELEDRKMALDLREREINRREQLLESLEEAALQKAGELSKLRDEANEILLTLQGKLEAERNARKQEFKVAVKGLAEDREVRISHLVSTVNGMRAAAGAGLLGTMEKNDAVEVLRQLSAKQAAVFLGAMPPQKAAELAEEMIGPKIPSAEILDEESSRSDTEDGE